MAKANAKYRGLSTTAAKAPPPVEMTDLLGGRDADLLWRARCGFIGRARGLLEEEVPEADESHQAKEEGDDDAERPTHRFGYLAGSEFADGRDGARWRPESWR